MGVALLNRHRGSTRVGRSGVARTIGCRHICATAALLTLLYGAPAMRCAWQTMLGIITYCMVWLFAGITLHEETVSWTVGMLRNLLAKRWSIRKFL